MYDRRRLEKLVRLGDPEAARRLVMQRAREHRLRSSALAALFDTLQHHCRPREVQLQHVLGLRRHQRVEVPGLLPRHVNTRHHAKEAY